MKAMVFRESYSQDPKATAARSYYWSNDDYRERKLEGSKKRYQAKKEAEVKQTRSMLGPNNARIEKEVKFHLGRGRDVGYIAVRMNIPVSMVNSAIEKIKASEGVKHDDA